MAATFAFERALGRRVAGVDEAGRGPWAGPVCAGAVVFAEERDAPAGVDDSKKLTPRRRARLAGEIRRTALACAVGWASPREVDAVGPLQASFRAMARALARLKMETDGVLVDGPIAPPFEGCGESRALVKGDGRSLSIAAASILAKTARDVYMSRLAGLYPGYGWATNMGYGAPAHRAGLARLGVTRHHRLSYRPVAAALAQTAETASGRQN